MLTIFPKRQPRLPFRVFSESGLITSGMLTLTAGATVLRFCRAVTPWRHLRLIYSMVVPLLLLSCAAQVMAQAHVVVEVAELERWHGEDNLYGEIYGSRIVMVADTMVTAGHRKAIFLRQYDDGWRAIQVLEPSLPNIDQVAMHGDWMIFGSTDVLGSMHGGSVSIFRYTESDVWEEHAVWSAPENSVTGYEVHNFG